ncbi:hypothetical protein TGFOU_249725 [Toxoplasma gondii FOU]|uniref:Uncharacterized protein n=1 Tax=Toxoplasma gondii FOU TaxID=943167 RepID=A0A086LC82_TOXGO|nr:hypothetical protein TGFOU_249725 [Toxoplasma gondii FOU]
MPEVTWISFATQRHALSTCKRYTLSWFFPDDFPSLKWTFSFKGPSEFPFCRPSDSTFLQRYTKIYQRQTARSAVVERLPRHTLSQEKAFGLHAGSTRFSLEKCDAHGRCSTGKIGGVAMFVASFLPDQRNEKIDHRCRFLTLLIRLRYYLHPLACLGKHTLQQICAGRFQAAFRQTLMPSRPVAFSGGRAHRGHRNENLRVKRRLCLAIRKLFGLRSSKTPDDFGELS